MRKAWEQVQKIIDANKRIKATVFHLNVALKFTQKTLIIARRLCLWL